MTTQQELEQHRFSVFDYTMSKFLSSIYLDRTIALNIKSSVLLMQTTN